jgi:lipoate-protein ligase A
MALDDALLESVSDHPTAAVFRTYRWSEPTLSLGYFQRIAELRREPRWRGVPLVRRPTGGGAIWHDAEITYALVLPRRHPAATRPLALYQTVHRAILQVLAVPGVPAATRGTHETTNCPDRPFLCFTDRDREDIVIGDQKIVGSAQRRRPGAVLQHGSLLLARSARTPELPGILELAGIDPDSIDWSARLAMEVIGALGLREEPADCTVSERARASDLEQLVYANEAWTARR